MSPAEEKQLLSDAKALCLSAESVCRDAELNPATEVDEQMLTGLENQMMLLRSTLVRLGVMEAKP